MQFGAHLRALRRAAGLTQAELAERAGLTANGVSALERGARTRPYPHTVRSLAVALGLAPDERERFLAAATRSANGRGKVVEDVVTPDRQPRAAAPGAVLPLTPTALVGRADEVAAIHSLVARPDVRLVTLTGTGGVGKSRLAVEVAHRMEGAAFVALAPLADPL